MLVLRHMKSANCFILNCFLFYVTKQHKTLGENGYLPSLTGEICNICHPQRMVSSDMLSPGDRPLFGIPICDLLKMGWTFFCGTTWGAMPLIPIHIKYSALLIGGLPWQGSSGGQSWRIAGQPPWYQLGHRSVQAYQPGNSLAPTFSHTFSKQLLLLPAVS